MNFFLKSQFKYCTLIWMCCNHSMNNNTNQLHEQCLGIVYSNKKSNFKEPLERDYSVYIHPQNIRFLAIEVFKVFKDISL